VGHAGVIVSPHTAGDTTEEKNALTDLLLDNLIRHGAGRPLPNIVNRQRGYAAYEARPAEV
jgi:phosphoglycerate dehydrogenase-like enzyme